jgi:hypothetical protein
MFYSDTELKVKHYLDDLSEEPWTEADFNRLFDEHDSKLRRWERAKRAFTRKLHGVKALSCYKFLTQSEGQVWKLTPPQPWEENAFAKSQNADSLAFRQKVTEMCPLSKLPQLAKKKCLDLDTFEKRMSKITPPRLELYEHQLRSLECKVLKIKFISTYAVNADDGIKAFSTAISSGALASLKELYIWGNRIGDEGMKAFSTALSSGALGSLQELYLDCNQIGDEGMKAFSSALSSGALASLTKLDLDQNKIGDEGMKAFSTALSSGALASLKELSLSGNKIGDDGMKAFSTALPSGGSLASLTTLHLENNKIGDAGMIAFSKALNLVSRTVFEWLDRRQLVGSAASKDKRGPARSLAPTGMPPALPMLVKLSITGNPGDEESVKKACSNRDIECNT